MKSPSLIALSLLALTAGNPAEAQASSHGIALDFSLPEVGSDNGSTGTPAIAGSSVDHLSGHEPAVVAIHAPLPIPPNAVNPPISQVAIALPASVYQGNAQALSAKVEGFAEALPPAPPTLVVPEVQVADASPAVVEAAALSPNRLPIALSFAFEPPVASDTVAQAETPAPELTPAVALSASEFAQVMESFVFEGGRDSLVARAIGSAEGTRTPTGGYTGAFNGHVDPGNQAWNLGTFSYQHGANSPEEADYKQLARLQSQAKIIQQKAEARGLTLDLTQTLNALDLANQSPLAALGQGGYMDRLVEAEAKGLEGSDAILWSRTYAYFDSDRQRWNAPGLGNTFQGVNRDQERRMNAIAQAVDRFGDIPATITQVAIAPLNESPASILDPAASPSQPLDLDNPVDQVIALDFDLPPKPALTAPVEMATMPESTLSPEVNPEASGLDAAAPPTPLTATQNPPPNVAVEPVAYDSVPAAVPQPMVWLPGQSQSEESAALVPADAASVQPLGNEHPSDEPSLATITSDWLLR